MVLINCNKEQKRIRIPLILLMQFYQNLILLDGSIQKLEPGGSVNIDH